MRPGVGQRVKARKEDSPAAAEITEVAITQSTNLAASTCAAVCTRTILAATVELSLSALTVLRSAMAHHLPVSPPCEDASAKAATTPTCHGKRAGANGFGSLHWPSSRSTSSSGIRLAALRLPE
jgi:hypothetical protein